LNRSGIRAVLKALRSHRPRLLRVQLHHHSPHVGRDPSNCRWRGRTAVGSRRSGCSVESGNERIERAAYMSVVTKFWIFLFVGGVIWIIGALELRDSEMVLPFMFAMVVGMGIGHYLFRCPRCRWRIISMPKAPLMTWIPSKSCRRCGANFSELAGRISKPLNKQSK
jgi:hypothetical protein